MLKCFQSSISVLFASFLLPLSHSSAQAQAVLADYKTKEFKIGVISTGRQPKGMEVTPDGQKLFVANLMGQLVDGSYRASVDVVDMTSLKRINTILTPTNPRIGPVGIIGNAEVAIPKDGEFVLVSRTEGKKEAEVYNQALLNVIDPRTEKLVTYVPLASAGAKIIAIRPDPNPRNAVAYITNWFSEDISVVSLGKIYQHLENRDPQAAPMLLPSALIKKISMRSAWPNPQKESRRQEGDTRELDQFKLAPRGVAFTADGRYALAVGYASGTLFVLDGQTHKVIAETEPVPDEVDGEKINGALNLRHIIISHDGQTAYLSHMRGDAVSAIDIPSLLREIPSQRKANEVALLKDGVWNRILKTWGRSNKTFIRVNDFPSEMRGMRNYKGAVARYSRAEPNTIILDPSNRYLIVSCRASDRDTKGYIVHQYGKVDIIDTFTGQLVISLVGGLAPTALATSKDGRVLVSSGFEDQTLHFYNLEKILNLYEERLSRLNSRMN